MNEQLSNKLKVISFVSILLVVVIHANHSDLTLTDQSRFNSSFWVQLFFSHGIAQIAVPLFFCISGYLFFLHFDGTWNNYYGKIRKRFSTLFIPFLFWSALGILLIYISQNLPFTSSWINQKPIAQLSFMQLLDLLFLHPIPYQFWFVIHLFVLVLIAPIIHLGLRYLNLFFVAAIFVVWMLQISESTLAIKSLFFFTTGAFLAKSKVSFNTRIIAQNTGFLLLIWLTILVLKTSLICAHYSNIFVLISLQNGATIIGMLTIWFGFDKLINTTEISSLKWFPYTQYTFFIFAFHEPALTVIKKVLLKITPHNDINLILVYFLTSMLSIALSLVVAILAKKSTPTLYGIITGNR